MIVVKFIFHPDSNNFALPETKGQHFKVLCLQILDLAEKSLTTPKGKAPEITFYDEQIMFDYPPTKIISKAQRKFSFLDRKA